jgi:hypothetical protein
VSLLDSRWERDQTASVAWALAKYTPPDLPALGPLTAFLRRCSPEHDGQVREAADAMGADQAIYAIERVLEHLDPEGPLTDQQLGLALQASQALAHAASVAGTYRPPAVPTYVPDPRERASAVLFSLATRFADESTRERYAAEWADHPQAAAAGADPALVWAVERATPQADGTLMLAGQPVDGRQPKPGKAVTLWVPERALPVRGVLREFAFAAQKWPPRVALVVNDLAPVAADAFSGGWVTSSFRDQHRGEFSEANLDKLEQLRQMDGADERWRGEFLAVLSDPLGEHEGS